MKKFIAVDYWEDDAEHTHVNPNLVAYVKLIPSVGGDNFVSIFPWTVVTTIISFSGLEDIEYYFKTKEKAKAFITNLGSII